MDTKLYRAAVNGDCSILAQASACSNTDDKAYFLTQTLEMKNNIIHIGVRQEHEDFVREALRSFPELISQTNSYGETPFHIAAESGNLRLLEILVSGYKEYLFKQSSSSSLQSCNGSIDHYPWRIKTAEGNTPLHVALIHAKLQFAEELVDQDPILADFVNNFGETPLHLAIKHRVDNDRDLVLDVMHTMQQAVTNTISTNVITRCPPKENSEGIIVLLLKTNSRAARLRDSSGLTPLLRAASSFKTPYVSAIESILIHSPQSVEVCDFSGKTILHLLNELPRYHEHEYLLSVPGIHGLKNHQDMEGNTSAHVAVKNRTIFMLQLLLFRLHSNFAIKNKEGVSAADLLQQQSDEFRNLVIAKDHGFVIPCTTAFEQKERLSSLLKKLGFRDSVFEVDEGNVLHVLGKEISRQRLWHENIRNRGDLIQEFIKQVIDSCPVLICETDRDGYTPLHKLIPEFIDEQMLFMFYHYFQKIKRESNNGELYHPPWRMRCRDGNTPLHLALLTGTQRWYSNSTVETVVAEFLRLDCKLASDQNNQMQTPFHLMSNVTSFSESFENLLKLMVTRWGGSKRDKNHLTALLNAAEKHNLGLVKLLYNIFPESIWGTKMDDGKLFWHLLASRRAANKPDYTDPSLEHFLKSFSYTDDYLLLHLLRATDNDGNTPLHLAIENGNFQLAQFFIEYAQKRYGRLDRWDKYLLNIANKNNVTPADLIGSVDHIPSEFEKFLWSKSKLVEDMLGVRSMTGVPTPMIKDYTNTIGVIAALLATITFTAAFTVPGGLNNNNGTPLLMKMAAFEVFMVSDILATCLSMMVLFCLLWIMTMANKKQSVVLLDLTIFLLQASFYATLVAFMTGLYVTTIHVKPWIAKLGCALCSSLVLLMHKRLIAFCIPTIIMIFFFTRRATFLFTEFLYLALCEVPKKAFFFI